MSTDQVETEPTINPAQQRVISRLMRVVGQQLGGWRGEPTGIEPYPGTVVPDVTTGLQNAFDMGADFGASPIGSETEAAILRALTADPSMTADRYLEGFQENVYEPSYLNYMRGERRQLEHAYGSEGGGGVLQSILADSRALFEANMAQQRGEFYQAGLTAEERATESARQTQAQGIELGNQTQLAALDAALRSGGMEYATTGQRLAEGYEKWYMSQPWANPWVTQFAGMSTSPTQQNIGVQSEFDRWGGIISNILATPELPG